MIDGLHFEIPTEAIRNSDVLEFRSYGGGLRAVYNGLIITDSNKPLSRVRGSIHKYFNNGLHNYNDLTLIDFIRTIDDLGKTLNINPSAIQISRVEFGVNVDININVDQFISYVLMYSNIVPTMTSKGIVFQLDAYDVKLYNKKLKGFNDRLRVEVAVKRARHRNAIIKEYARYCNTLDDLTNTNIWRAFANELVRVFDDILIVDKESIDYANLSANEVEILSKGLNPFHWKSFSNRQTRANHFERFLSVVNSRGGNNTKESVKRAIQSKTNELINIENIPTYQDESLTFTADLNDEVKFENLTFTARLGNKAIDNNLTFTAKLGDEVEDESLTFTAVDKGGNRQYLDTNNRVCKITSLNLNIGIKQNDVLSTKGVKYYYLNEREIYNEKLYPLLSEKMKSKSLEKQFEAISHSLRNKKSNPRNNLKRDLKNIAQGVPMIFDFADMLREDKKEIYKKELQKYSI